MRLAMTRSFNRLSKLAITILRSALHQRNKGSPSNLPSCFLYYSFANCCTSPLYLTSTYRYYYRRRFANFAHCALLVSDCFLTIKTKRLQQRSILKRDKNGRLAVGIRVFVRDGRSNHQNVCLRPMVVSSRNVACAVALQHEVNDTAVVTVSARFDSGANHLQVTSDARKQGAARSGFHILHNHIIKGIVVNLREPEQSFVGFLPAIDQEAFVLFHILA